MAKATRTALQAIDGIKQIINTLSGYNEPEARGGMIRELPLSTGRVLRLTEQEYQEVERMIDSARPTTAPPARSATGQPMAHQPLPGRPLDAQAEISRRMTELSRRGLGPMMPGMGPPTGPMSGGGGS